MADPAIILVSERHADVLLEEFQSRYARDYTLHAAQSCAEAEAIAREIIDGGGQVALFVTDSRLPDVDYIFEAFHRWRLVIADRTPGSRRALGLLRRGRPGAPGRAWRRASTTPTC